MYPMMSIIVLENGLPFFSQKKRRVIPLLIFLVLLHLFCSIAIRNLSPIILPIIHRGHNVTMNSFI